MSATYRIANARRRWWPAIGLAMLSGTAAAAMPQPHVINGAFSNAWPGMGSLVTFEGQYYSECSATLIAPQWVLTAAHCLGVSGTPMFTMAQDFLSPSATYYTSDSTFIHPNYVIGGDAAQPYDFGLVHFPTPIPAMPYRLNDNTSLVQSGDIVQYIGYGQTIVGPEGSDNNTMRRLGTSTLSQVDTHSMGSQSGSSACFGDSGSGWFTRHTDGFPLIVSVQSYFGTNNCNGLFYAAPTSDALSFLNAHVTDLCLTSTAGAPCDGIFRNDLEALP